MDQLGTVLKGLRVNDEPENAASHRSEIHKAASVVPMVG